MSIELTTSDHMAKLAMDKSILREYVNNLNERIVYLNNNDEFQIQLFNPETFVIGAEISINGETLPGMLVINPGQRIWLERPMMGNNRKFKFETYTVENSAAVEQAIKNNGEIRIRFYKEHHEIAYQPNYPQVRYCKNSDYPDYLGSSAKRFCNVPLNMDVFSSNINMDIFSSDIIEQTNSATYINPEKINTPEKEIKETGRIGAGDVSNQKFHTVNNEFETYAYRTETMKILPMSQKPFTSSDLRKKYCVNCGRKLNPKYKFCPYCGVKCD